jgi:hypothetical protein
MIRALTIVAAIIDLSPDVEDLRILAQTVLLLPLLRELDAVYFPWCSDDKELETKSDV